MQRETVKVRALPKQATFLRSTARELLLSGGYGCGKSIALAIKLAMRATVLGSRELLVRKFFSTLNRSTLSTLLEGDGDTPPVLPAGTYRHNKTAHEIRVNGGGSIIYLGCDDAVKLGSINATGAAIDEAAELTHADMVMIRGRVRSRIKGLNPQIYMATNPGGPLHHLAKRFGLDGEREPTRNTEAIMMRTDENPHLPEEYVTDLSSLVGAERARVFEGKWVSAEGLVYPGFDYSRMVRYRPTPAEGWQKVVIGQDAGFNDPDALLVVCKDHAGRLHVGEEFCASGQLIDAIVTEDERLYHVHRPSAIAVDPSAARLRETLHQKGLPVVKAENPILDGIRAVQRYMTTDGDGEPMFTVDPSCTNTIKELTTYAWDTRRSGETKDVPQDKFNHCCDALRYAVMEMDGHMAFIGIVAEPLDDDGWGHLDGWRSSSPARVW